MGRIEVNGGIIFDPKWVSSSQRGRVLPQAPRREDVEGLDSGPTRSPGGLGIQPPESSSLGEHLQGPHHQGGGLRCDGPRRRGQDRRQLPHRRGEERRHLLLRRPTVAGLPPSGEGHDDRVGAHLRLLELRAPADRGNKLCLSQRLH